MPKSFKFINSQHIPPLSGVALSSELKKHHLYITASLNEPSGNHHIEAAQCGLPLLYIESGGIPEHCNGYGVPFNEINFFDENNIVGTLKLQGKKNIFKPNNDVENNYWFSLNREDISKFTGKEFSKYLIYLGGNYEFPKPKKITANISNNHKKYAITWFSLAISILLLYLYFRKKNY